MQRFLACLLSALLCFIADVSRAGDTITVLRSIPISASLMSVDELGNVYVVRANNELIRYNEHGDSSASYRSVQNGSIGQIDAVNPLRIIVYYPAYSKVIVLDRMLALKNELDLRKQRVFNAPAIASSADGNVWFYDQFNARLKKIDDQLNEIVQSNDLRQEIQTVPSVSFLTERNWKVFMCDTVRGILTFDRYGNYINTLSIFGVKQLQVFGDQLIYRREDTLFSWDVNKVVSNALIVPRRELGIISAAVVRNTLYVLYADRLVLYRLPDQH